MSSAHISSNGIRSSGVHTGIASSVSTASPRQPSAKNTAQCRLYPSVNWKCNSPRHSRSRGVTFNSSCVSRTAASWADSPGSRRPPGALIFPAPSPRYFRISKISAPRITKQSVARSRGCHWFQSPFMAGFPISILFEQEAFFHKGNRSHMFHVEQAILLHCRKQVVFQKSDSLRKQENRSMWNIATISILM